MIALLASLAVGTPCVSSCAAPARSEELPLRPDMLADLTGLLADEVDRDALETLIFHADQTLEWLADHPDAPAPDWLETELRRDAAEVSFRLVADDGAVMVAAEEPVRSGKKQHVILSDPDGLGWIDVNGRVRRVGVDHLWARF